MTEREIGSLYRSSIQYMEFVLRDIYIDINKTGEKDIVYIEKISEKLNSYSFMISQLHINLLPDLIGMTQTNLNKLEQSIKIDAGYDEKAKLVKAINEQLALINSCLKLLNDSYEDSRQYYKLFKDDNSPEIVEISNKINSYFKK